MTDFNKYNTPAYQAQKDFGPDKDGWIKNLSNLKSEFLDAWSNYVNYSTINSITGNPWTSKYDHPRSWYQNPIGENYVIPSPENTDPVRWTAFPNRVKHYYYDQLKCLFSGDAYKKLYELGDIGPLKFATKYSQFSSKIPENPCEKNSPKTAPYNPDGPRGWQGEYCEWVVRRDDEEIVSVNFTHENPEYWFHLWNISPDLVVHLYNEILPDKNVCEEDLYLYDKNEKPVIVRETGRPAYNPINKWNNGTIADSTKGGAIHLTSPPNALQAEIYLGAAATILREEKGKIIKSPDRLICASQYGAIFRNSDPRIGLTVNLLVQKSVKVTLTNPIALYGQKPNFSLFKLPEGANKTIEDCYTVVRGYEVLPADKGYYPNNMILHSKFEVPEGANFKLGDISIRSGITGNWEKLEWGSQIAETFKVQLAGTVYPGNGSPTPFPPVIPRENQLPNIMYLLDLNILRASFFQKLNIYSGLTTNITKVEKNASTPNIAILANNVTELESIEFDFGDDVTTLIKDSYQLGNQQVLFIVTINVGEVAEIGARPAIIYNQGASEKYPLVGLLEVVPYGSLPKLKVQPKYEKITKEELEHLKTVLS